MQVAAAAGAIQQTLRPEVPREVPWHHVAARHQKAVVRTGPVQYVKHMCTKEFRVICTSLHHIMGCRTCRTCCT